MLSNRRAKIVVTVGPAIRSPENLSRAIHAGMNVARLNFSHGSHADHAEVIQSIRGLSKELKRPIAILQDLQGPKIRVGKLKGGQVNLVEGSEIDISAEIEIGDENTISTDFQFFVESCEVGAKVLLDDGQMELVVISKTKSKVRCRVIYGGVLLDRKGINLPGADLPLACLTEKDLKDLEFGLAKQVDYIALSFVRKGSDISHLRELVNKANPSIKIIAKIEMLEALRNLEEIVGLSDAVMVARGDLAVEVGQSQLPLWQKEIIRKCNELGRPVVTATQMLDSMVENPRPTRAEITDIANAVIDGSDALMLSAESASGKYPIKCIQTMSEIITEVERSADLYYDITLNREFVDVAESISASASLSALKLDAPIIVCLSTTGRTATQISKFRPKAQIIAVTHVPETLNRLELVWGIHTLLIRRYQTVEDAIEQIQSQLLEHELVKKGDRFIVTFGMPVAQSAKTNSMRVYTV